MKSVIITGSSSGLGYFLAKEFLKRGFKVYGLARTSSNIADKNYTGFEVDINDHVKVESLLKTITSLDILINNAGYARFGSILDLDVDDFKRQFNTNLFSQIKLIQMLVSRLKSSDNPKIVNIGSMSGYLPTPLGGAYCSSKAGFNIITDILKMELKSHGISVIKVIPGVFQSNFGNRAKSQLRLKDSNYYRNIEEVLNKRVYISQKLKTDTQKYAIKLTNRIIKTRSSKTLLLAKGIIGGILFNYLVPTPLRGLILLKFYPLEAKAD